MPEAPHTPWGPKALYIHYCAMLTGTIRQLGGTCSYGGGYLWLCVWQPTPQGHVWQEKMKETLEEMESLAPQSGLLNSGPSGSSRLA